MFAVMEFQVNFPGKDAEIRQKLPVGGYSFETHKVKAN